MPSGMPQASNLDSRLQALRIFEAGPTKTEYAE
jgi:hypothetical protein